ncbi:MULTISPECIES: YybH family protein [Aequorivita]|uniref:Nuclear transport factor 2 family protein n=1 Tax=Aequorivita iocasae TaxID=2803865 RepID=A0ABX7DSY8_9FLAO|nr:MULTISPECIES: nuclear transport factor 2 family protein [Aequorivita]QQX77270.1 nuclear transport factor 2 family protein [Aequorivita iocasae]UCA56759.1 nuclear transport factor 2 family protein [Aequorivita sp. F7]
MRKLFTFICLIATLNAISQTEAEDKKAILTVLKMQEDAWNQNNLEDFMQGYWKSDSLKFYGSNGLTQGWQKTLDNYKKGYPSKEYTGNLSFTIDAITKIEKDSYYLMGQFHLVRDAGNANGVFLIIFRKIEGEWKIIADLSC